MQDLIVMLSKTKVFENLSHHCVQCVINLRLRMIKLFTLLEMCESIMKL